MQENTNMSLVTDTPYIISASKCTDIPAFYMDWFMKRLEVGFSCWLSPITGKKSTISFENVRFIVFWSKNPRPLLNYLDKIDDFGIKYYIQYTLNDYECEGLEPGIPSLQYRIDTFKMLVDRLSPKHVIWRFDPLILTNTISDDTLVDKIQCIGEKLQGYTEKLVFSYADISSYKKVRDNLVNNCVEYKDWSTETMLCFAKKLASANEKMDYILATCGEKIDLSEYGIMHNKCIDDELIIRLAYSDKKLMNHLGVIVKSPNNHPSSIDAQSAPMLLSNGAYAVRTKDNDTGRNGKRHYCGCIPSRDVGEYNTCQHLCLYCYANESREIVNQNNNSHIRIPFADTISGR